MYGTPICEADAKKVTTSTKREGGGAMAHASPKVATQLQAALFVGAMTKIAQAMRGQSSTYDLEETEWLLFQHWGAHMSSAHAATVLALEIVRHAMEIAEVEEMHERFALIEQRARDLAAGLNLALDGHTAAPAPATVTPMPLRRYGG